MKIYDTEIEVIRSSRKSVAIEVSKNLTIIVRVPRCFPEKEIMPILLKHEAWIRSSLEKIREKNEKYPEPTREEATELIKKACEILPQKVKYWSEITGLFPTGMKITSAKTRFGSCSSKNSVCFSYRVMLYPEKAIDYVVLHELVHIKHHNHSKDFYALLASYMPDYKDREALLRP